MDEIHHGFPLVEIATVIVIAVLAGLGLMRLKQPPLVGFILAGVVMGPTGFGLISNNDNVTALAEMGVLVLLFFIGTELSLKAFVATLRPAVIVAAGQLAAAMVIGAGIAWLTGSTVAEGVILGFIIALSSTVVAMKMLDDMGALRKLPGRITVGVLIAQDIAVVPMLILISSFGGAGANALELFLKIAVAVGLLGALLWWLGRSPKIKVPFDEQVGENVELLALGSLAACFAAAAASGAIGLSPAYGAFVAGLVIGNSSLRNKVIPVIEPIQSVLLVVFFLSIGLLIDLDYIRAHLGVVLAAALFVIAIKTLLNVFLLRVAGFDRDTALVGGLSMAQIGEFSFVLAAAGFAAGALGYDIYRLSIAVTAITLLVSPAWMALMRRAEEVAMVNYSSYREGLAEAYSGEIENVEEGFWWLKVRYRAGRIARRKRREAKAARKASSSSGESGTSETAPPESAAQSALADGENPAES
ncbi:cation:proton antiporter [Oricola cellulosilytica]|uniref:cation:proton antiporter n=1 Tax=Oricola cellulosilytica TaxID=1429082 RepID=UPI001CBAB927|nr:cation:proton antiporter [Oricola cellulosilytica]